MRAHVVALAAPEMDGRLTGSEGERLATEYVARQFEAAGLEAAGLNGTWFQPFEFTAGVSLGASNALRARGAKGSGPALDRDWRPLAFSRTGEASDTPVAFAGYGIVAPASDGVPAYDSYAGLDVQGKLVLLLRYAPQDVAPEQRQHLSRYASLRHKAMLARDRGAVGVLFVSGPRSPVREQLVALRNDQAVGATSIFALSLTDALAGTWLKGAGRELAALQQALDTGAPVPRLRDPRAPPGPARGSRAGAAQRPQRDRAPAHAARRRRGSGAGGRARGSPRPRRRHQLAGARGRARSGAPGADDNASGVAALIEIARQLRAQAARSPAPSRATCCSPPGPARSSA